MEDIKEKKSSYTPAVKKAIDKYRSKNVDRYNELQRQYYETNKEDEEWKQKFNERCKENNKKYRERKRLENPPKPKGRPRKPMPIVNINALL
jgi:type I site-specific restriction-modification system R (restriction) subunit